MGTYMILVNAKNKVYGRLCTFVIKSLTIGKRICVICCSGLVVSRNNKRRRKKKTRIMNKVHSTNNHRCGPTHYRSSSCVFLYAVCGMIPYKFATSKLLLNKLKCYDEIP